MQLFACNESSKFVFLNWQFESRLFCRALFETFHANKNQVDSKYESVNGKIITKEGHCLGGLWENLSKHSDKFAREFPFWFSSREKR